ncbi:MAG TPA: ABC transporter permease [Nitrospirota bacterium]|nr:ABC transporter permease [Nitrospirota bacterium]
MYKAPAITIALRGLRVNKMRSALTMLGIIIGVAAVITMLAVGEGARVSLAKSIASLGSNMILVVPGSTTSGGARMGSGNVNTFVYEDVEAITGEASAVEAAAPIVRGSAQVIYADRNWSTSVLGTTADYEYVRDWRVTRGRFLTKQDVDGRTKNTLIGTAVADELFGGEDPQGKIIRIKNVPFTVVGVLEKKGQSPNGQDQDDVLIVPMTTAQSRLFGITHLNAAMVKGRSLDQMDRAVEQLTSILRQRHKIAEGEDDDFTVRNLTEMLSMAEMQTKIMSILLGSIASVSLLVGGIGIMNIMLVSVTERTREIGIRMAVGAKENDILLQFLIEALVLSLIGGVVGIAIGVGGSLIIGAFSTFETHVSVFSVVLAFCFSAAVGIFFGFYPARKAARMDPITALRYE